MKSQNFLHDMRVRATTHVMQERGGTGCDSIFGLDYITLAQTIDDARHQVQHAERVCKARMLCALICIKGEAQLLDTTQALKLRRVNQARHQLSFVCVGTKTNDVVDRVAV